MQKLREEMMPMLADMCRQFGVDPKLMAAIITVESNWDTFAVRFEPIFNLRSLKTGEFAKALRITEETERMLCKCSWGLGQIMGGTARGIGYTGPLQRLCEPDIGMLYAVKYFSRLLKRYPDHHDAIAAYNQGSVEIGEFKHYRNQGYVDKVLSSIQPIDVIAAPG